MQFHISNHFTLKINKYTLVQEKTPYNYFYHNCFYYFKFFRCLVLKVTLVAVLKFSLAIIEIF